MTAYKEPITINITASPDELRRLADKMEIVAARRSIGMNCFVDFLAYDKHYQVKLFFDQEKTKGSPNYNPNAT